MIDIRDATLCWRNDDVWIAAGDVGPVRNGSAQPIDSLETACVAAWLAATDGVAVADVHAALLQLDKYEQFFREP